jgi:type IV pilus assembly protein PilE
MKNRCIACGAASLRSRGFTLIELMITVAIVAILAAVAYPSYVDHIRRSRISEATGLLSMTRVRLEQFYQDNSRTYGTGSACGVAMPTGVDSFTFSCSSSSSNQAFLLTATGNTGSTMTGFTYTVDDANAQITTAFPGASGLPASCWLKRKGDTC